MKWQPVRGEWQGRREAPACQLLRVAALLVPESNQKRRSAWPTAAEAAASVGVQGRGGLGGVDLLSLLGVTHRAHARSCQVVDLNMHQTTG